MVGHRDADADQIKAKRTLKSTGRLIMKLAPKGRLARFATC
jgi:hypothetical protein